MIEYARNGAVQRMVLKANSLYQFENATDIVLRGKVFIITDESSSHQYTDVSNFEGFPLLPGVSIISDKNYTILDVTHNKNLIMHAGNMYIIKGLGFESDEYNFHISYPNGFYYARLHHLSEKKNNRAGVILLSPHSGSDSTTPVVNLSDNIRIPVYSKMTIALDRHITELSSYRVTLDADNTVDSNKDGVFDNDFENTSEASIQNNSLMI